MIDSRAHLGRNLLAVCGVDAFLFSHLPNIRYLMRVYRY